MRLITSSRVWSIQPNKRTSEVKNQGGSEISVSQAIRRPLNALYVPFLMHLHLLGKLPLIEARSEVDQYALQTDTNACTGP